MHGIANDVRQATRRLAASPLMSAGAIVALAVGIASVVVMGNILDALLLQMPPRVGEPQRVARLYVGGNGRSYMSLIPYAAFEAIERQREEVESGSVYFTERLSLGRGNDARPVEVVAHSADYFTVLGVRPRTGSWAAAGDGDAVISDDLWHVAFGGRPDVVGQPLRLGTDVYTITAVAPTGFVGIDETPTDVWLPLAPRARATYGDQWRAAALFLRGIVRLRPGVSRQRASAQATAAFAAVAPPWQRGSLLLFGDLRAGRAPGAPVVARVEVLVAGMALVLLLITCGNVASLVLLQGLRRGREFVVKAALGASRARLVREVLVEAVILASAAGLTALVLARAGVRGLHRVVLSPDAALPAFGWRAAALTACVSFAAMLLLGSSPASQLSSRRALHLRTSRSDRSGRLLTAFTSLQIALSLPLVVAAALFVLSLWHARHQDFGMETSQVAVVAADLFEVGRPYDSEATHRRIQARLESLPQVEVVAMTDGLPMRTNHSAPVEVEGQESAGAVVTSDDVPGISAVDPSFFKVMGLRLVAGRLFTDDDNRQAAPGVAVVTAPMARRYWPNRSALGKCLYRSGRDGACTTVVGVVAEVRRVPSIRPTSMWASAYYVPLAQDPITSDRVLLVKTVGEPAPLLQILRSEAQQAAADLPYVEVRVFDDVFRALLQPWRLGSTIFALFGGIAILVAGFGLIAVGAHSVNQRVRELGIRAALGAAPARLVALVMRRSLAAIALGVAMGVVLSWLSGRIMQEQLFGVTASDPRVLMTAVTGVCLVAAVAAWLPARRAARVDPSAALRTE